MSLVTLIRSSSIQGLPVRVVGVGAALGACVIALTTLAGCAGGGSASAQDTGPAAGAPATTLMEPSDALKPLGFMAGRWYAVNPNKTVNREHWMAPASASMSGLFMQVRRDGGVSFYEVSSIVADKGTVKLFLRHLHRELADGERQREVSIFTLKTIQDGRVTFVPAVDVAGGIESMTYRADGPDRLVQELVFKPDSKEKNFSTVYWREGR